MKTARASPMGIDNPSEIIALGHIHHSLLSADYLLCRTDNPDSSASAAAAARAFLANLRALTEKAEMTLDTLEDSKP